MCLFVHPIDIKRGIGSLWYKITIKLFLDNTKTENIFLLYPWWWYPGTHILWHVFYFILLYVKRSILWYVRRQNVIWITYIIELHCTHKLIYRWRIGILILYMNIFHQHLVFAYSAVNDRNVTPRLWIYLKTTNIPYSLSTYHIYICNVYMYVYNVHYVLDVNCTLARTYL